MKVLRRRLEVKRITAVELRLALAGADVMIVFGTGPVGLEPPLFEIVRLPPREQFVIRANRWIWL